MRSLHVNIKQALQSEPLRRPFGRHQAIAEHLCCPLSNCRDRLRPGAFRGAAIEGRFRVVFETELDSSSGLFIRNQARDVEPKVDTGRDAPAGNTESLWNIRKFAKVQSRCNLHFRSR